MQLVINTPATLITHKDVIFRLKHEEKRFDISPLKVSSQHGRNSARKSAAKD